MPGMTPWREMIREVAAVGCYLAGPRKDHDRGDRVRKLLRRRGLRLTYQKPRATIPGNLCARLH